MDHLRVHPGYLWWIWGGGIFQSTNVFNSNSQKKKQAENPSFTNPGKPLWNTKAWLLLHLKFKSWMKYVLFFSTKKNSGWSHQRVIYLHPSEHSRNNDWLEEMQRKHCGFQAKSFFLGGGGGMFHHSVENFIAWVISHSILPNLWWKTSQSGGCTTEFFSTAPPLQLCCRSSAPEKQTSKSLVWHVNKLTFWSFQSVLLTQPLLYIYKSLVTWPTWGLISISQYHPQKNGAKMARTVFPQLLGPLGQLLVWG